MEKRNLIVDLTMDFALDIIKYCDVLEGNRKYVIAKQLLRSGTSIGANVRESQSAESKNDFIHKLKIADKEANEVEYWLELCEKSESYPPTSDLNEKILSIKKVAFIWFSSFLCIVTVCVVTIGQCVVLYAMCTVDVLFNFYDLFRFDSYCFNKNL